jgi:GH35 family endo-1,4-beta-xylanase
VEWSFKTAEKYFGANRLVINEAHCRIWDWPWFLGSRSSYLMQIERAMLKGARIDSIGMQFHMFHKAEDVVQATRAFYNPRRLFDVMDAYAALGLPIQITEITIPAYSTDPGDEEVQAEILRELYRIWFSHRAMEAIIYWNLPDGYAAWSEPGDFSCGENAYYGGLCRFDMTPKPAYRVVKDLFGREWRTNFAKDVSGCLSFCGFHGGYELVATSNGRTVRQAFDLGPSYPHALEVKFP